MEAAIKSLKTEKEFLIEPTPFILGREEGNNLVIKNAFVSRNHCKIFKKNSKFFLEDLKSANGTYKNGERISSPVELENNDIITICNKGESFLFKIKSLNKEDISLIKKDNSIVKKIIVEKEKKINFLFIFSVVLIFLMLVFSLYLKRKDIYLHLIKDNVKKEFYKLMLRYGEKDFPLRDDFIEKIRVYIKKYKNSGHINKGLERRKEYIEMIEKTFKKHKIPKDLSYIAFVESNYNRYAYNKRSGARGMWQFMPATAREYGLRVNRKTDERIDPEKSTEAAARYINDLLAIFGVDSFTIALAAYNAGDGFLRTSLTQIQDPQKDRSFWYLYKNELIPLETQEYVLKILALMILCENPDIKI